MRSETFYSCDVCHKSFTDFDTCKEHEETCKGMKREKALLLTVMFKDGKIYFAQETMNPTMIDLFINQHMAPQLNGSTSTIRISITCWASEKEEAKNRLFTYLQQVFSTSFRVIKEMADNSYNVVESSVDIKYLSEQVYEDYKSNNHKE